MTSARAPQRGDLVWLSMDPQAGHEQAGRRPALVLSPGAYNQKVGLALCCPITSAVKGYPFEVGLPSDCAVRGVVLSDQVRSLDWRVRRAEVIGRVGHAVVADVCRNVLVLLGSAEAEAS